MKFLKWVVSLLFSQRGEGEGEGDGSGEGAGSGEGQGNQDASGQGDGQQGQQGQQGAAPTLEQVMAELNQLKSSHETLKGQSGATERNLSSERKALEQMGLRVVRDADGNVQVLPIQKQQGGSRFTDEHKNKFFTYFPDAKQGEEFLNILNLLLEDHADRRFQHYDKTVSERQSFTSQRDESIGRMYELYPSLNQKDKGFNKAFYDRADAILAEKYWDRKSNRPSIPNADLVAAHEAAIEMGIAPSSVEQAKKEGFEQGKNQRRIVGVSGSRAAEGGGGFRRLEFEEYKKLTPEQREEYDKKEVETRGK